MILLTGQLRYDNGIVMVFGKEPGNLTGKDKKKFGIMMENFGVYERFSCGENLSVFADIYDISHDRIQEILEEVGLENAFKKAASDLSKGMKARLQLARTFLHSPQIIFLDEPTSGLDPQTMRGIHRIILEKKNAGCTIFLTTHNMLEATKLCDKVALLNEGKIVEEGNPEEIRRKYDYHKRIKIHLSDGEDIELYKGEQSAEKISELLKAGRIETIHSTEPTLESIFLELTGKNLEENG